MITYGNIYAALYTSNLERWLGDDHWASFQTATLLAGAVGLNYLLLGLLMPRAYRSLPDWLAVAPILAIFIGHYVARTPVVCPTHVG